MGAGKTILIGAIIATEFAMALEHPDGSFVQNALVFAPGKTIIESLRELLEIPYEKIVPLTFTRDGEKDIPVTRGSPFNVIVTNTEKIRIQKETVRKGDLGMLFSSAREDEAREEIANLRLQTIASLPHLAVFSDEAHHTYLANGFRGKVTLIYIDPPFDSGADYVRKVSLRGAKGMAKLDGESYTLGEQIQYTDIWANDNYLQFMYERLLMLKETLCEGGSVFLHCDETQSHRLRCLLDEVFGPENFQNEIIWYYTNKYGAGSQAFDVFHNSIFWYSKGKLQGFNTIRIPVKEPRLQPVRRWNKELGKNEWLRGPDGKYLYKGEQGEGPRGRVGDSRYQPHGQ